MSWENHDQLPSPPREWIELDDGYGRVRAFLFTGVATLAMPCDDGLHCRSVLSVNKMVPAALAALNIVKHPPRRGVDVHVVACLLCLNFAMASGIQFPRQADGRLVVVHVMVLMVPISTKLPASPYRAGIEKHRTFPARTGSTT